jgi:tripartite-type tricarboxylate transporter receptor subunit TctC
MHLTGNTILITGGTSGIGRALAEAFHRRDNQVIITGRRQALLNEITATNLGMRGMQLDVQDLNAIKAFIADQVTSLVQIHGGTVKAYAVTSKSRLAAAPDIPTVDEAGLPTFHTSVWDAMWAPKGTPPPVIAKLNAAIVETLSEPALRERLQQLGQNVVPREQQTPEALDKLQKAEIEKWWPIITAAGITAE